MIFRSWSVRHDPQISKHLWTCWFLLFAVSAGFAPPHAAAQSELPLVKLMAVGQAESAPGRTFFGRAVARETVSLAFQVDGQIVEFPVTEGQALPRGSLVARLDLEPLELRRDEARERAAQADRTLRRFRQLVGTAVTAVRLEEAETEANLANIALRNAERSLGDATLVAPFEAVVAAREVANFTTVSAGVPVVRLHDMSELRIEIDVPEVLFRQAGQNPDVEIWVRFAGDDRRYPAELREFNAETSAQGQTFKITLGMEPPADATILPGSSARVEAAIRGVGGPIVVPASALVPGPAGQVHVMVFEPAGGRAGGETGTVRRTPVAIQATPGGAVAVVGGLAAGQEIVSTGAALLSDGASVRRFSGF